MAREYLAVVWASLKLRPDFEGDRFLVRTDHDCPRWLLNIEGLGNPRLAHWRLRLSELECDVVYRPGMTHYMAESISRLDFGASDETAFDDAVPVFAVRADTVRGSIPPTTSAALQSVALTATWCSRPKPTTGTEKRS